MAVAVVFKIPGRKLFCVLMPDIASASVTAREIKNTHSGTFVAICTGNGAVFQRIRQGGMYEKKSDVFDNAH